MGHGASPKHEKNLDMEKVTSIYAWGGNLEDSMKRIEKLIDALYENPDDNDSWNELEREQSRFVNRSKGFAYDVKGLILQQNRSRS